MLGGDGLTNSLIAPVIQQLRLSIHPVCFTYTARFEIDVENPHQSLRPGHPARRSMEVLGSSVERALSRMTISACRLNRSMQHMH